MPLTPLFLDELRARTMLSALVAKSVKLQRSGDEYKACCPFHTEKTPSFWVNDDKGFGHCFGCTWHGDAIRWMTDYHGLSFMDAVKELVAAAGMEMPAQDARSARQAERAKGLHELMADAQTWFVDRLGDEGHVARDALAKRGIKPETARAFGMGYAPDSRGKLKAALASYGDPMLVESGMLISVENKEPYDRFRGRLMIPIRDARGRTIAFGGRILGDGEPKYLNSPETPLFDKGRTLYNIDRAQAAARKAKRVIAVEGYMDVIALAQAGFDEVVAPLGTALTEHQLERLWRMADCPILCFDGDAAGIKAARRAAERALPMLTPGKSIAIVTIPNGMDPDDLVRSGGAQAFAAVLATSEGLCDFLCRMAFAELAGTVVGPDQRAACQAGLQRLVSTIADPLIRREYDRTIRDRCWHQFRRSPAPIAVTPSAPTTDPFDWLHSLLLDELPLHDGLIDTHVELVAALPLSPQLAAIRDRLLDSAATGKAIQVEQRPPRFLADDLVMMMQCLVAEVASRHAEHRAAAACKADTTEATWAALLSAREASASNHRHLRDWIERLHHPT